MTAVLAPDAYVLCTSPRCGSTMLSRMLAATGIAGHPDSWFHRPSLDAWAKAHGVAPGPGLLARVFTAATARARGAGGPAGIRMQAHSFPHFRLRLAELRPESPSDSARLGALWDRVAYIHLWREDVVAQAVSYVRATQTGLWHRRADGTELERSGPPAPARYDPEAISERVAAFREDRAMWDRWFAAEGVAPLTLTYEGLVADPAGALARVLSGLGLDPAAAAGLAPQTARLADAESARWVARFRAEVRNR